MVLRNVVFYSEKGLFDIMGSWKHPLIMNKEKGKENSH